MCFFFKCSWVWTFSLTFCVTTLHTHFQNSIQLDMIKHILTTSTLMLSFRTAQCTCHLQRVLQNQSSIMRACLYSISVKTPLNFSECLDLYNEKQMEFLSRLFRIVSFLYNLFEKNIRPRPKKYKIKWHIMNVIKQFYKSLIILLIAIVFANIYLMITISWATGTAYTKTYKILSWK